MKRSSALETLEYPCSYPLKVVGKKTSAFETTVIDLVKQLLPENHPISIRKNPSKKNTYVSITVTFEASNQQQIESLYQVLYDCPQVVMTL